MSNDKTRETETITVPGFSLAVLQKEAAVWSLHNFGKRPASQPLRGIIKELGELSQSFLRGPDSREYVLDAVADTVIFMADYCTCMSFDLASIAQTDSYKRPFLMFIDGVNWGGVLRCIGELCHHDLKLEQKIRLNQDHEAHIKESLGSIYIFLEFICAKLGTDLLDETYKVWQSVKNRDWKKNAVTGA